MNEWDAFDRALSDSMEALPPPEEEVKQITPWRQALDEILIGLVLTTVRLDLLYLQYILPAVGAAHLYLGFRTLRRDNKWFRLCWLLAMGKAVFQYAGTLLIATPLANCTNMEYLEVQETDLTDLSPLAGLVNLKHLNICWLENVTDITPLYGLTNLERLWIGNMTPIPQDQIDTIREKLPNCVINTTTYNPTEEGWREGERYQLLKEQFGYDEGAYSFYYLDPKYYPQS